MRPLVIGCFALLLPVVAQSQLSYPVVQSRYPAPGATGVPRNTVILVSLSASGIIATPALKLAPVSNPAATVPVTTDSRYYSTEFVWRPTAALAASTAYTASFSISDYSSTIQFTTGTEVDVALPRVVSITPDPNLGRVDPVGPFRFLFDKPLALWDMAAAATDGSGSALTLSSILSEDRRTLEVRTIPENRLPGTVKVQLDPARIRDMSWNSPNSVPITAQYTTAIGVDYPGPKLIGQYPAPGETSVPTNALLQFLFDTPLYQYDPAPAFVLESRVKAK